MKEETLKEKELYQTTSLVLATVISQEYPIEAIERDNSGEATFIFKRKQGLDELLKKFWKQELRVEPQQFFNQINVVKSQLHDRN